MKAIRKIRVLTVTDLHQRRPLYEQLREAVAEHKPDIVACVGDFLDLGEAAGQSLSVPETVSILSGLPCELVFVRGNHEDENWRDFELEWLSLGRKLNALHGEPFGFGPLTMVGFPCWLGNDEAYSQNRSMRIYNPENWLPDLLKETGPAGRTLWLMHEPPSLEISSYEAYEPEWKCAVENWRPFVTVSGHDHSTPMKTGRWHAKIRETVCINAGQRVYPKPGELAYCVLDFQFPSETPSLPARFTFERFA